MATLLFRDGGLYYHIETSSLICRANQWTDFYMIVVTSVMKELNQIFFVGISLKKINLKRIQNPKMESFTKAVKYFYKMLPFRCLAGFWTRLWKSKSLIRYCFPNLTNVIVFILRLTFSPPKTVLWNLTNLIYPHIFFQSTITFKNNSILLFYPHLLYNVFFIFLSLFSRFKINVPVV